MPRKAVEDSGGFLAVADLVAIRAAVGRDDPDFAYVVSASTTSPNDTERFRGWEAAGASWWLEALHPWGGGATSMRARVRAGPPTV